MSQSLFNSGLLLRSDEVKENILKLKVTIPFQFRSIITFGMMK